jgi:hypothetical protein
MPLYMPYGGQGQEQRQQQQQQQQQRSGGMGKGGVMPRRPTPEQLQYLQQQHAAQMGGQLPSLDQLQHLAMSL